MKKIALLLLSLIVSKREVKSQPGAEILLDIHTSFPGDSRLQSRGAMMHYKDGLFRVITSDKNLQDGLYKLRSFTLGYWLWFGRFYSEPRLVNYEAV